jgi:hypothetical protein
MATDAPSCALMCAMYVISICFVKSDHSVQTMVLGFQKQQARVVHVSDMSREKAYINALQYLHNMSPTPECGKFGSEQN